MHGCCGKGVDVVCPAIHGVQLPTAELTGFGDLLLHYSSLLRVQSAGVFGHSGGCLEFPNWIRKLPTLAILDPAAYVAGQPSPIG